jgi:hypothetical protein
MCIPEQSSTAPIAYIANTCLGQKAQTECGGQKISRYRLNYIEASKPLCGKNVSSCHLLRFKPNTAFAPSVLSRRTPLSWLDCRWGIPYAFRWARMSLVGSQMFDRQGLTRCGQNDRKTRMRRRLHDGCYYIVCLMIKLRKRLVIVARGVSKSKKALRRKGEENEIYAQRRNSLENAR